MDITFDYVPQPRQFLLHNTKARQILYGGAAGGGKSHALRWDAIQFCLSNPGLQAYLFRRTLRELEGTHIRPIRREIPRELGDYSQSNKRFDFSNGSSIWFCYCEHESDIDKYLSEELHWVGLDEASKFSPMQIAFLKTRNRLGGFKPKDRDRLPRFAMASNPGGPSHPYLKATFIDPYPPETMFFDDEMRDPTNPLDRGWPSIYIPAKIADNRFLDEDYSASFGGLPPEMQRAYREGDWDAVVGAALHNLTREKHCLRQFTPPKHWTRFMSIDWGTAKPFSVGWYAVSEGALIKGREGWPDRWIPSGAVIRYQEYYGWNGKPNQGCRLDSPSVAKEVIRLEKSRHDVMDYRVGDSQMWAQTDGPSTFERMRNATDGVFTMRQAKKDRTAGYAEICARLAGEYFDFGGDERQVPMLYVTENCTHFWRTCPSLLLDDTDPEKGPGDKQEDHIYDELAYACRSRPYIHTEETRWYEAVKEYLPGRSVDPYATA